MANFAQYRAFIASGFVVVRFHHICKQSNKSPSTVLKPLKLILEKSLSNLFVCYGSSLQGTWYSSLMTLLRRTDRVVDLPFALNTKAIFIICVSLAILLINLSETPSSNSLRLIVVLKYTHRFLLSKEGLHNRFESLKMDNI